MYNATPAVILTLSTLVPIERSRALTAVQLISTCAASNNTRYSCSSTYKFKRAFFPTRPSDRAQIWHECADRDETGSHQKKLTNPTPEGCRGLFIDVCGIWDVCGIFQAGGR